MSKHQFVSMSAFLSLMAAVVSFAAESSSAGTLIGVNFEGRSGSPVVLAATDTAGVLPQANWNNVVNADGSNNNIGNITTGPLIDSAAGATAVSLNIVSNDSWNSGASGPSPDYTLENGIVKAQNGFTDTFTFSNVPVGSPTNVYVYTAENGDAFGTLTIGAQSYSTHEISGGSFAGTFIRGVDASIQSNYVEFTNVSPVAGQIILTITHTGGSDGFGTAGLQLQVVPEPSSFILCALGALGLFVVARRRRKA